MAKALVINGANFSANKVDTVNFVDLPCTGITLNQSTVTLSSFGINTTLTPTVSPSGCTDPVIWTTSNSSVATVSEGVVTSVRPGTAVITASCGDFSATCTVTVAISVAYAKNVNTQIQVVQGRMIDSLLGVDMTNNRMITLGAAEISGEYPISCSRTTGDIASIYPYPIPEGATTINVVHTNFASIIAYLNKDVKSTEELQERVRDSAKVLNGETSSGGTDWSINGWTYDERTYTIPSTSGIDSFCLLLNSKTGTTAFANFDPDDIVITFGY